MPNGTDDKNTDFSSDFDNAPTQTAPPKATSKKAKVSIQKTDTGFGSDFDEALKKKDSTNDGGTQNTTPSTIPSTAQENVIESKTTDELKTDFSSYLQNNLQYLKQGSQNKISPTDLQAITTQAMNGDISALKKVKDFIAEGGKSGQMQSVMNNASDNTSIAQSKQVQLQKSKDAPLPADELIKNFAMSSMIAKYKAAGKEVDPIAIADQFEKEFYGRGSETMAVRAATGKSSTVGKQFNIAADAQIVKENKNYRLESKGLDALYDYENAQYKSLKQQYDQAPNEDLRTKVNDKVADITKISDQYKDLYNKYPQVAQQQFNRLIKDNIAKNKSSLLPHFFTTQDDIDDAVKRETEADPNFATNFSKQIAGLKDKTGLFQDTEIGTQGIVDAIRRGTVGVGRDVYSLFLTHDERAALNESSQYKASDLPTSYAGSSRVPKIIVSKDGKTFAEAKNDLSTNFNSAVNFIGESAPGILEFAALEEAGSALKIGTGITKAAKLGTGLLGELSEATTGAISGTESIGAAAKMTKNFTTLGETGTKIASNINRTIGLVGAQYGTSFIKNYDDAYEKLNPKNADDLGRVKSMAHLYTLSEALAFKAMGITPSEIIQGSLRESVGKDIYKFITEEDLSKITPEQLSKKMYATWKDKLPAILKASGVEAAKMGGISTIQQVFKDAINNTFDPNIKSTKASDYLEAFKSGAALGGVFGLFGNLRNYKDISPATGDILYSLGQDNDKYNSIVDKGVEDGTIPQDRATELKKIINTSAKSVSDVKDKLYNDGTPLKDIDKIKISKNNFRAAFLDNLEKEDNANKEKIEEEKNAIKKQNDDILNNSPNKEVSININPETLQIETIKPTQDEKTENTQTKNAEGKEGEIENAENPQTQKVPVDFSGKDNNFLANKEPNFFTPEERVKYNDLMKTDEGQKEASQMVSDRKEEILSQSKTENNGSDKKREEINDKSQNNGEKVSEESNGKKGNEKNDVSDTANSLSKGTDAEKASVPSIEDKKFNNKDAQSLSESAARLRIEGDTEGADALDKRAKELEEENNTGIKKSISEAERVSRNLEPVNLPRLDNKSDVLKNGKKNVDSGKINPREVAQRVVNNNGIYSPEEAGAMQYYAHQLSKSEINLTEEINSHPENSDERVHAAAKLQQLMDDVDLFTQANRINSNSWGKLGNVMQIETDKSFNPSLIRTVVKENYGGEIPKEVQSKIDEALKMRDAAIQELLDAKSKMSLDAIIKEVEFQERQTKTKQTREQLRNERKDIIQEIKKSIKKDLGNLHSGIPIPTETLNAIGKLAVNYFKDGTESIKILTDKIYHDLNGYDLGLDKKSIREAILNYAPLRESAKQKEAEKLQKKESSLNKKIELGEIKEPKSKSDIVFKKSPEMIKAEARITKAEFQLKKIQRESLESKKNWYQKGLMWLGRGFKLSILSGKVVLEKLAAAAIIGGALKRMPEQAIGKVYSTAFKGVSEKAPIEGNIYGNSEANFYKEFFNPAKFADNAWQILKTGESRLSQKMGNADFEHVPVLYLPTDLHQIIKEPLKRATFEASFRNGLIHAEKNGYDINDPLIINSVENAAYKRANYEIFQESNAVSRAFSEWKGKLEKGEGKILGLAIKDRDAGATAKFVADFMIPISTVPINMFRRTISSSPLGLMRGIGKLGLAYRKGIENLSTQEAETVMRQLKQGTLGTALWMVGWYGASNFGGLWTQFNPDKKRKGGDLISNQMQINDMDIPAPVQHALPLRIIQAAATARHIYDLYSDNDESDFKTITTTGLGSIGATVGDLPILETPINAFSALTTPYGEKKLGEDIERRVEPQILKDIGVIDK